MSTAGNRLRKEEGAKGLIRAGERWECEENGRIVLL